MRRWPGNAARQGYGAAPPASRVLHIALRATALRAALDPGDLCGPLGQERGQAPACPSAARRARAKMTAAARPGPCHMTAEDTNRNRCSSNQKNAEITRNRFEEVFTVSGEARLRGRWRASRTLSRVGSLPKPRDGRVQW